MKPQKPTSPQAPSFHSFSRLADLFNEAGMLKKIPRSGFAFLGSGEESVAEHSFRTCVIGFALARLSGADLARTVFLCLFHDLHEARTGDFNYVNHRYNSANARQALENAVEETGLETEILSAFDEFEAGESLEAITAHDADQLDLICNLQQELAKGNQFAVEWLDSALARLRLPISRELADAILKTDPNNWWYGRIDKTWWISHGKERQ